MSKRETKDGARNINTGSSPYASSTPRLRNKISDFLSYLNKLLSNRYALYIIIALLIALALWLRIHDIGGKDVWLDEANSVIIAEKDPPQVMASLSQDGNPPLYYMLLHYWMIFFGQSEVAVRSLSVIFGVILVFSLFFIGRKLFSEQVGWYASVIAAVAPIQVMYSQQIRMYTLLPLLSLLSMHFLFLFLQEGKKLFWILYVLCTALAIYTHNYGLMLLPAQAILAVLYLKNQRAFLWWLLGVAIVIMIYSPWIPALLTQSENPRWHELFWERDGLAGSLFQTLQSFSPGGTQQPYVPLNAIRWLPFIPVVVFTVLLVAGLSPLFSGKKDIPKIKIVWLLVYGIVPLITVGILSFFTPCYIAGRCDQIVFPAFCLLAAVGISRFRPGMIQAAAIIFVVFMSFMTLYDYYGANLKEGNKQIAEAVRQHLKPGDAIVCTSLTRASLEYYLQENRFLFTIYSYPAENAHHLGNNAEKRLFLENPRMLDREAKLLYEKLKHGGTKRGRCLLLYVHSPGNNFLKQQFESNVPKEDIALIGKFRQSMKQSPVMVLLINSL